jgi:hypothetical protein
MIRTGKSLVGDLGILSITFPHNKDSRSILLVKKRVCMTVQMDTVGHKKTGVVPENSIQADSRDHRESQHDPA